MALRPSGVHDSERREESRRGTQECVRHIGVQCVRGVAARGEGLEAGQAIACPTRVLSHVLTVVALIVFGTLGLAQQAIPHAGYVYPAGGRQGGHVRSHGGRAVFMDGVDRAIVSGTGVQATIVEYFKPLTQGQATQLRDRLKELMEKSPRNAADEASIAEIRKKLAGFLRRPTAPAIAEIVRVQIALAPGASLGDRELRLATTNGLTNPLKFCIDALPEFSEPAAKAMGAARGVQIRPAPAPPNDVTLPVIINGQITLGGVDRYRFQAIKGQHIVLAAKARELIPYISDAVPGWFQAAMSLTDAKGREVGYADHFQFHPDPVLYYEIPEDGPYVLAIHDSIYRGREDFVYRISVGELPFVTSIFPLGGRAGQRTSVELRGWNLPAGRIVEEGKGKAAGVYPLVARQGEFHSNAVPFAIDALREVGEREPNHRKENAQRVVVPVIVNGRIEQAGDTDVFRIDGKAGDEVDRGDHGAAAQLAARFAAPPDRRGREGTRRQRRLRRQGGGTAHASGGFADPREAARERRLLPLRGRYARLGRTRLWLPAAHQPSAARFRAARHAGEHQCARGGDDPGHGICAAPRRFCGRDRRQAGKTRPRDSF